MYFGRYLEVRVTHAPQKGKIVAVTGQKKIVVPGAHTGLAVGRKPPGDDPSLKTVVTSITPRAAGGFEVWTDDHRRMVIIPRSMREVHVDLII